MFQVQIWVDDVGEWYAPGFLPQTEFRTRKESAKAAKIARKKFWTTRVVKVKA